MPTYSNTNPPLALYPGDVCYSFGSKDVTGTQTGEAIPANGTSGSQMVLPAFTGPQPESARAVRWQTIFSGTAVTAVNLVLQGALNDVDAEYATIDTSTAVGGEARQVNGVIARFIRIKLVSATGGDATSKLVAKAGA